MPTYVLFVLNNGTVREYSCRVDLPIVVANVAKELNN